MGELSVDRSRLESFLPLLGAEVDNDGYIRDIESGDVCLSPDGEKLTIEEIGYLGSGENGEIEPVRDDFSAIVEYLSDSEEWEKP